MPVNGSHKGFPRMAFALGLAATLAGCQHAAPNQATPGGGGGAPTPAPSATPAPKPTPTPGPTKGVVLDLDWSKSTDVPFSDPTTPTDQASGRFFVGDWSVQGGMYTQSASPSSAALSFRAYNGNAFGMADGMAPAHYRVDAEMEAYKASDMSPQDMAGAPVGILGLIPYYLDSTHYILLDATPNEAECWFVDGLQPGDEWDASKYRVWNKDLATPIGIGQKVQWGAEIDLNADTVSIYYMGQLQQVIPGGQFLQPGVNHQIALLSNGNYVGYDHFTLTNY